MMEPRTDLGQALAQLRSLRGLSIAQCAAGIGAPPASVRDAERGLLDDGLTAALARFYALDPNELRDGFVQPLEGVPGATIFLLHGPYQDFDAEDLGALERAMRAARMLSASLSDGRDAPLRCRMQFVPARPAGPSPRDAARQGYKLARSVRTRLSLGSAPLGDVRVLLEERLGVAVVVDALVTTDLRAASVLDADRGAAAAVLNDGDPQRAENPLLARVYLAHELGHLLFDPSLPGCVQVALDDRLHDRSTGSGVTALLESRAKGFAAELLMPLDGLTELLGAPARVGGLAEARRAVQQSRERFGTPWEITCWHLSNHGFVAGDLAFDIVKTKPVPPLSIPHETTLPTARGEVRTLGATPALRAAIAAEPPPYVAEAWHAASSALEAMTDELLTRVRDAVAAGRPTEAVNIVVGWLDDLLHGRNVAAAARTLAKLDPGAVPPEVSTGALMATLQAREALGAAREDFLRRVEIALTDRWRLDPPLVQATVRRLR